MKFIDAYIKTLNAEYRNWAIPEEDNEIFKGLYELGSAIDSVVPDQIKLQEYCISIGPLTAAAIVSKSTLSKGSSTQKLAGLIQDGLTQDTAIWVSEWAKAKTTAITAGSVSGAFVPAFPFPAEPLNGSLCKVSILKSARPDSPGLFALSSALQRYMTYWYNYYIISGPPNSYAVI